MAQVRLRLVDHLADAVRYAAVSQEISLGSLLQEGVGLLWATLGQAAPQRGVRRLRPGRRAEGLDDLPIVILDDSEAA